MDKKMIVLIIIILIVACVAIGYIFIKNQNSKNIISGLTETQNKSNKKVAKDGTTMQTEDSDKSTRVLENGTKINMYYGDTKIEGLLNDSTTARALIEKLKEGDITIHESRYSHDFCGTVEQDWLPYNEEDVHYGWLNGDIDYAIDAPYFTTLIDDEDISEQYGYQVNIGIVTSPLSKIRNLKGSYEMRIELAED